MRTWILLALLGLVLLISMRYREGADSTLAPTPTCPSGHVEVGIQSGRCVGLTGVSPDSNNKCRSGWDDEGEFGGPYAFPPDLKQFDQKCVKFIMSKCPSGYVVDNKVGHKCIPDPHMPPISSPSTPTTALASAAKDANNGPLPPPIDGTTGRGGDSGANRPMNGPVFGDNGPFSGQAGTGQGSGMNAAATLTGSTYAHPPPTEARLDPYDFWPGTKGNSGAGNTFLSKGASLPVMGPDWGGPGKATTAAMSRASQPGPTLYGPAGTKTCKNSTDTSMVPSFSSAGSDPSNQYAATSRVPGDQDPFASAYAMASSYSLANGSRKTDPVPYLTDFSTFQR